MMRHPRFSLVELLVVIAVISMLMSILLPALNKAKSTAQAISCAGNGRQLMVAMTGYLNDFNDIFPCKQTGSGASVRCWGDRLASYLGFENFDNGKVPRASVWACPSQLLWTGAFMRVSYAYNAYLFGDTDYGCVNGDPFWGRPRTPPPPIRSTYVKSPSEQLVFVDGWTYCDTAERRSGGYPYLEDMGYVGLRHQRRCNVIYMGGNVKAEDKAHSMDAHPAFYPINATCENKPYLFYQGIFMTDYSPY